MLSRIGPVVLERSVEGIEKGFLNKDLETIEQVKEALGRDATLNEAYEKAGVRYSSHSAETLGQDVFTGKINSPWHRKSCPWCKHNAAVVNSILEKEVQNV